MQRPEFRVTPVPRDEEDPTNGTSHILVECFLPGEIPYLEVEIHANHIETFWSKETQRPMSAKVDGEDYGGMRFNNSIAKLIER